MRAAPARPLASLSTRMTSAGLARPSARLIVLLALLGAWLIVAPILYNDWTYRGGDWITVAIAGRIVDRGDASALYTRAPGRLMVDNPLWEEEAQALRYERNLYPFIYPPLIAYALAPLAGLDLAEAKPVVLHAELVLLALMIGLACWQWRPQWLQPAPMALMLLLTLTSAPLHVAIACMNIHPLVLACVMLAMVAAQRNAPRLAGASLALAIFIKVLPAVLLLYWLAQRRWASAAWCAAALALLTLLSLGVAGLPLHLSYLDSVRDMSTHVMPSVWNKSLPALLYDIGVEDLDASVILRLVPLPDWIRVSAFLAMLAGLAAALIDARRYRDDPQADAAGMISVFLIATLCSPNAWNHYFTILLPACIVWAAMAPSRRSVVAMAGVQTVLASWPLTRFGVLLRESGWPGWAVGGEFFAGLLLVGALLIARASRQPAERGDLPQLRERTLPA